MVKISIYGMEKNRQITTIKNTQHRLNRSWRVMLSYLFAILLGGVVGLTAIYFESGEIPIMLWIIYIPTAFLISLRPIYYDLLEPKEFDFYENQVHVFLSFFNREQEWIICYEDVLITRIGYSLDKKRRRIKVRDRKHHSHLCTLDLSSGWTEDLQFEVLEQFRNAGVCRITDK